MTKEANYTDLLVLGQPDPDDNTDKHKDLVDQVVLSAGRPCLIVPYIGAGKNIGNMFLSYLADNGHDLLVMGAYGHSRFREAILGGMTREIMQSMTVPVLMSH